MGSKNLAAEKRFNLVPGCLAGRALGEVGVYPILLDLYIWLGFRFLGVGYFAFVVEVGDISHWKEGISFKEAQVQGSVVLKSKWVGETDKVHLVQGSGSLVVATVAVERNSFNVRSHLFQQPISNYHILDF